RGRLPAHRRWKSGNPLNGLTVGCPPDSEAGEKAANYGMATAFVHPAGPAGAHKSALCAAQPPVEPSHEVLEPPRRNGVAQAMHQVQVVVQVVDRRQDRPEHLTAFVQMAQIGAAEATAAGVAGA